MPNLRVIISVFVICTNLISVFGQRIEGRHLRPNQEKCHRQNGCSTRDGYIPEEDDGDVSKSRHSSSAVDSYRSIAEGARPNIDDVYKHSGDESYKPIRDRDDYDHKERRPSTVGEGYNRKPVGDRTDYVLKPVDDHNPKFDTYVPPGSGHNRKPVRGGGGYNPRPVPDRDHGTYNPKPDVTDDGGYNPKPGSDREDRPYNPKPDITGVDGYNPKPGYDRDHGTYNPKPVITGGGGYNPRPVPDRDHGSYNPIPDITGVGGYNPKPGSDRDHGTYNPKPDDTGYGGYNPKPGTDKDGYVPRPVRDDYPSYPSGGRDDPKPISGGGYRPKPPINRDHHISKPTSGGGDHNPDGSNRRPIHPDYPNKDLGGYNDPKDDDYSDDTGIGGGIKDHDYVGEVKPIPVVEVGNCICVPYYQCQEGHIVTDGAGIIDARKRPEPEEELPLDGKFKPPSCGPFHVCCNTPETSTVKPYEHRCGVRNPSGINSRILSPSNKGEADFGEWPWQAAVLKAEGKVNIFQCGGVLIDKFHVLTVAHCVFHLYKFNEYPLKVRLGEWDTQTTTEFLAHEDYRVSKIMIHPEYRNTSLWNDVAILRLEDAVLFAPHIDTICLPKYDEVFAEQNCVVTGWGKDAYKGGTFSNIMKEVALQVIDNYKCEEMLRKTRLGRFFQLHEGFMCAGGEYGLDSCKGDGGGPLVCYRKDKSYALAGIVSWGIDCGQPGVPGVYIKIQKYLDWISKNTGVQVEDYWPRH